MDGRKRTALPCSSVSSTPLALLPTAPSLLLLSTSLIAAPLLSMSLLTLTPAPSRPT